MDQLSLKELKELHARGVIIIGLFHEAGGSAKNSTGAILVSYDLQAAHDPALRTRFEARGFEIYGFSDFDTIGAARIVSYDTEPGDITVHHARTIHGAYANASATQRRRAISVRYAGDDTVFSPVAGGLTKPHHAHMRAGDPLDPAACPLAWPREAIGGSKTSP